MQGKFYNYTGKFEKISYLSVSDDTGESIAYKALTMLLAGHSLSEPMLKNMLNGLKNKKIQSLKKSFKIPIKVHIFLKFTLNLIRMGDFY